MFPSISVAPLSPGANVFRFDAGFTVPVSGSSWVMPVPLEVPTGGGPRPIEELGPLLVEIAGDVGLVPDVAALVVLSLAVVLLLVRRSRRRRSTRAAVGRGSASGGAGRTSEGAGRSASGPAGRRPGAPPLFAGRDEEPDQFTMRWRDATDPLAVIEALRSVDEPAAAVDAPPPPAPAPAPAPGPAPAPVSPPPPSPAPGPSPAYRSPLDRSSEGSPIGWMLAGGATALVIARLFGRGRGSGRG
jgi:hypothetical protein